MNSWFLPRSPGEGQLVARVADVGWRMGVSRLEERLVNSAAGKKIGGACDPAAGHERDEK